MGSAQKSATRHGPVVRTAVLLQPTVLAAGFAACLIVVSGLLIRSMDATPVQIDLQQARLLAGGNDLGYFLQKEVSVAARKNGWPSPCYGEVKFANGDEAHVLPGSPGKDPVLGGVLSYWSDVKFLITFHPNNASKMKSIRLVCDDGSSDWITIDEPKQTLASKD